MNKVLQNENCVVYDNIFEEQQFINIFKYINNEEYSLPHLDGWKKVWRLTDGFGYGGKSYYSDQGPYNNYVDTFVNLFTELAKNHGDLVGKYKNINIRSYLYPRETKLSWHNDKGYVAAAIFYTHLHWGSTWGGELLLAKTPEVEGCPDPSLNHSFEDKLINHYGVGQYITCKPNRLVLTKAGVWHSINRVDKDAGDNVRCSVVGFYMT
jgi:hypothetical protein